MTDAGGYVGEAQQAARENCRVRKLKPVKGFDDSSRVKVSEILQSSPMALAVAIVGVEIVRAFAKPKPKRRKRRRRLK